MTAEAWINTTEYDPTGGSSVWNQNWAILDFDRNEYFNLYIDKKTGTVGFSTNGPSEGSPDDMKGHIFVADGKWHHIAAVYDGTNEYIYVDGQLDAVEYNPHNGQGLGRAGTTRYGYIGDGSESSTFNSTRNDYYYTGKVDEVRLWSTARSQAEIQANMNKRLKGCESGLVLYYDFNEGSGTEIYDKANHTYSLFAGTISWETSGAPLEDCAGPESTGTNTGGTVLAENSGKWYRYGFNGQEKDDEVAGNGNSYTATFWQYDSRLGRRWNLDPVISPYLSPYEVFINNPILYIDSNGDTPGPPKPEKNGTSEGEIQTTQVTEEIPDPLNPGMKQTYTFKEKWYWHQGSQQNNSKYAAGWYNASDYKKILTRSSSGATEAIPLSIKLALGDFTGFKSIGVITEQDLTTDELVALRKIALANYRRGKMRIDYADYKTMTGNNPYSDITSINAPTTGTGNTDRFYKLFQNPSYVLKTSFGAATLVVEDGKLYVVDQYNFNDAESAQSGKSRMQIVHDWYLGAIQSGRNVYKQMRNMGTYYGSQEGQGPSVKILIKQFKK